MCGPGQMLAIEKLVLSRRKARIRHIPATQGKIKIPCFDCHQDNGCKSGWPALVKDRIREAQALSTRNGPAPGFHPAAVGTGALNSALQHLGQRSKLGRIQNGVLSRMEESGELGRSRVLSIQGFSGSHLLPEKEPMRPAGKSGPSLWNLIFKMRFNSPSLRIMSIRASLKPSKCRYINIENISTPA